MTKEEMDLIVEAMRKRNAEHLKTIETVEQLEEVQRAEPGVNWRIGDNYYDYEVFPNKKVKTLYFPP